MISMNDGWSVNGSWSEDALILEILGGRGFPVDDGKD